MQILFNNPFRILGVLIGTSTREQHSRTRKLKMFLEADQEPEEDFSFPVLGHFSRNVESIDKAVASINLNKDRMQAAIFWFLDGGIADESAFDAMKSGDINTAAQLWRKLTSNGEVNSRNYSAFQNLSTFLLFIAFGNADSKIEWLEEAVIDKLKLLESEFINKFILLATDENYHVKKEELQILFLSTVQPEAEKRGVNSQQFLSILDKVTFSAKTAYLKGFSQGPIEAIEKFIAEAKQSRKSNPADAAAVGNSLFTQVNEPLYQLKSMLGTSDIRYSTVADKAAEEILQCGIDYFKHFRDSETDPSKGAMNCLKRANSIAAGNMTRQRCKENIENLQEWIDDKPNRERQKVVINDLEQVATILSLFEHKAQTIASAKALLSMTQLSLQKIKSVLGVADELYLGVSSRIASDAQGMMIAEINDLQHKLESAYDPKTKLTLLVKLKSQIEEAWAITQQIGSMDLRSDFRSNFNSNKQALSNLRTQLSGLNLRTGSAGSRTSTNSGGGGGCYIATMAYGSYQHPQVLHLRRFRDEVLAKSILGMLFIRTYYACSPRMVKALGNQPTINAIIRTILNQIIKML